MQTQMNVANQSQKLRRQQSAYLTYAGGLEAEDSVVDNLVQLNWANIGNCATPAGAHVVEVSAATPYRTYKYRERQELTQAYYF